MSIDMSIVLLGQAVLLIREGPAALLRHGHRITRECILFRQSRLSVSYCLSGKVLSGVDHIEDGHCEVDHHSIEDDEKSLVGDDLAIPSLEQLDGSVDASNEDDDRAEDHGGDEDLAVLDILRRKRLLRDRDDLLSFAETEGLDRSLREESIDSFGEEKRVEDHDDHLADNSADHDASAIVCILAGLSTLRSYR